MLFEVRFFLPSVSSEAKLFCVFVSSEFIQNFGGFFGVFPRRFGSEFDSAVRVCGPASETRVPEVVRVSIGIHLDTKVALAVKLARLLEALGQFSSSHILIHHCA